MTKDSPPILRPLNLADILDQSISLYRRNFAVFVGITAIVYVPVGIIQMAFGYFMGSLQQSAPGNPDQIPWHQMGGFGIAIFGLILVSIIAVPIGQGALAIAVSRRYLNEEVTVADAYHAIGARWGPLIATALILGLAIGAGTLFCLVPGIYLGVLWMFATAVIALEAITSPTEAAKRSNELVQGEWWRCFRTYAVLSILVSIVTQALAMPLTLASTLGLMQHNMALAQAINQGVATAAGVLVQPVLMVGLVMLYYDLRIRKEGFDLELLAQALGTSLPLAPKVETLWTDLTPPPPPAPPLAPPAAAPPDAPEEPVRWAGALDAPAPPEAPSSPNAPPPVGGAANSDDSEPRNW